MSAPRVAVIAIHGVGDHQPFDMAKSVSSLLSDLEDLDQGRRIPRYSPFTEHMIRVNVAPVNVTGRGFANEVAGKPGQNISEDRSWGPMGALYDSGIKVDHAANACPDSLDHLFLEGQLAKYKGDGPEETYEALRLEGKRCANAALGREHEAVHGAGSAIPETEVHVYDMLWADLSGVKTAGLRVFGEIYQLTLHLPSIGVNNV